MKNEIMLATLKLDLNYYLNKHPNLNKDEYNRLGICIMKVSELACITYNYVGQEINISELQADVSMFIFEQLSKGKFDKTKLISVKSAYNYILTIAKNKAAYEIRSYLSKNNGKKTISLEEEVADENTFDF